MSKYKINLLLARLIYFVIASTTIISVLITIGEDRWYVWVGAVITFWELYTPKERR